MSGSMSVLEAGLRGGGIALLLLLAIAGWRDARRAAAARYGALFALCAIAYLIESAPPLASEHPPWIVPIRLLSVIAPAVFQLWSAANFDNSFVPRWWRWLPSVGMAALALWAIISDRAPPWRAAQLAALLLVGAGLWEALAGRDADLLEGRRRFRLVLAVGVGLCIVGLTLLAYAASQGIHAYGALIGPGSVLALALASALLRLRIEPRPEFDLDSAAAEPTARLATAPTVAMDAEERALLDRLQQLMESDRIYREEGLGIAALAARLAIPEYRLRRLINQRLGHRNFTAYINGYRLAETTTALADPAQARVPILTIALDAGFQSLGPFNRAFKAHAGVTPSEFRRDRLGEQHAAPQANDPLPASSPIPKSASG